MAAFLVIEGVTGSILAFEGPIGSWLDSFQLPARQVVGTATLDFATLATFAERVEPNIEVAYFVSSGPDVAILRCLPRIDPATQKPFRVNFSHIVLDAHTGKDLGRLPDGWNGRPLSGRVIPFVKDLHYNLILGNAGVWALWGVALVWSIDCLFSFLLTLPASGRKFWSKWKIAWLIKWDASAYRLNFDLHRAGGLWFWAALFVFAWSSVQLEDQAGIYDDVMLVLFEYQRPEETLAMWPKHDATPLKLDWFAAQKRGQELMDAQAKQMGFKVLSPVSLVKFTENGLYNYEVLTDRRFPNPVRETVFFDGDTGKLKVLPGFDSTFGNTISNWMRALHMATDPMDYLAYRIFVCVFGIILSIVALTGVYIWWKKRRARLTSSSRLMNALDPLAVESQT